MSLTFLKACPEIKSNQGDKNWCYEELQADSRVHLFPSSKLVLIKNTLWKLTVYYVVAIVLYTFFWLTFKYHKV